MAADSGTMMPYSRLGTPRVVVVVRERKIKIETRCGELRCYHRPQLVSGQPGSTARKVFDCSGVFAMACACRLVSGGGLDRKLNQEANRDSATVLALQPVRLLKTGPRTAGWIAGEEK